MKSLALILAIFTLFLSIVPFEGVCCDWQGEEISGSQNTESNEQDNDDRDGETCPPLCGCQCSHIHVISVEYNRVTDRLVYVEKNKMSSGYDDGISFDLLHSIWHPPEFS